MYPTATPLAIGGGTLPLTGAPIASLLLVATVLVLSGLLAARGSVILRPQAHR